MWTLYDLTLRVDRLVGGIPKHPEVIKRWHEARWPERKDALGPDDPKTPEEAAERTVSLLGDQAMEEAAVWTGFVQTAEGELAIESRQIKAMLKESSNILRPELVKLDEKRLKQARARLAETVFVEPRLLGLGVTEPTASPERAIHVMTAQGPRNALKRTDVVEDAEVRCILRVLRSGPITEVVLRMVLEHAGYNGLGTDRSQGNGLFTWKLEPR